VPTRLERVARGDLDAVILATAGLERLGLSTRITEVFSFHRVLTAPAQGALAVQTRAGDHALRAVLGRIEHAPTPRAVTAERAAAGGGGQPMSERRVRVATTRDEAAGGPLAEALARWGMEPVRCATIAHVPPLDPGPLERAARELERYDWLIVASARAVAALAVPRGGRPLPSGLRTAAVGAKTAARLEAHGAVSPLIPRAAGAAALLVALRAADEWRDRRVLMPRAAEGGREIARALGGRGAVVDEVVAYRTIE